jgi:fructokinase
VITVVGEALIDLVGTGDATFRAFPGGAPANVAVGLARLQTPVSLLARIGEDAFGRMIRDHLTGNGVSTRDLVTAAEPTTLAVAVLDAEGRASYDFYVHGTADWQWESFELPDPLPADVTALHAGSLALALDPGARVIEEMLRREHRRGTVTIMLDPNIRPALAQDRSDELTRVERQVALADVVKASEEDLAWLCPGEPLESVARRWRDLGPRLVVVTLGPEGAYALGPDGGELRRPSRPVELADTVGAGDAFCAGLLDAMDQADLLGAGAGGSLDALDTGTITTLLDRALLVAALTCERPGADPPFRADVDAATGPPA